MVRPPTAAPSKRARSATPCYSHYPSPRHTSEEGSPAPSPPSPARTQRSLTDPLDCFDYSDVDELRSIDSGSEYAPPRAQRHSPARRQSQADPNCPERAITKLSKKHVRPTRKQSRSDKNPNPSPAEARAAATRQANKNRVRRERRQAVADALKAAVHSGRINAHTVTQGTLDSIALAATRKWDRAEQYRIEKEGRKKEDRRRKSQAEEIKKTEMEAEVEREREDTVLEMSDSDEEIDLLDDD